MMDRVVVKRPRDSPEHSSAPPPRKQQLGPAPPALAPPESYFQPPPPHQQVHYPATGIMLDSNNNNSYPQSHHQHHQHHFSPASPSFVQDQDDSVAHQQQHLHYPVSSPPLVPSPSPALHPVAVFGGVPQHRPDAMSPASHHLSPPSPSAQSMTSSMTYATPALSSGTMSTSTSQDCFSPRSQHPLSPVMVYPSVSPVNSPGLGVGGIGIGGQYFQSVTSSSMGKQGSHAGRVFINPPNAAGAARPHEREAKGKWREREVERPLPLAPFTRPGDAPSRKGEDIGLDLGDFDMLDTLGTGTFGKVILSRLRPTSTPAAGPMDRTQPHYFAMKVLEKVTVVRLRQVEHLNSERSTLAHVSHPFIVNLFCTFQDEQNLYLLLEYVQGGELFSHLRRAGRFSPDVSRFYIANLVLALEHLHSLDIIYRDLKPENLLIDSTGYLKITDFGFAKHVTDRTYTLCGTPEYLAPEIITATGHGSAADYWALGVLAYELLAGYPPFFADSPLEIYERILQNKFSFPPHIDFVARDLIKRLLTADLSKRLGNLKNGARDVKNHRWFEGVDWAAVERKEIRAPIIPLAAGNEDTSNFERYPKSALEDLPGVLRAHQARKYMISPDLLERQPDPYGYLFPSF